MPLLCEPLQIGFLNDLWRGGSKIFGELLMFTMNPQALCIHFHKNCESRLIVQAGHVGVYAQMAPKYSHTCATQIGIDYHTL